MSLNLCNLGGKLVLVTGAGTGIGQGIAMALAEMGADVALHYSRSAEGAREAVAQITAHGPPGHRHPGRPGASWRTAAGWWMRRPPSWAGWMAW